MELVNMKNYIKSHMDKIIADNKHIMQEIKLKKEKLQELEDIVKNKKGFLDSVKAIKTKAEIKKLKKEIQELERKKFSVFSFVFVIIFVLIIIFLVLFNSCISEDERYEPITDEINTEDVISDITEIYTEETEVITSIEIESTEEYLIHVHSFDFATCLKPKTCTVCGETSGDVAEHVFSGASCVNCGAENPDYNFEYYVWIPTNGGSKYHCRSGCSGMKNPQEITESEAIARGYSPCGRCF